MPIPMVLMTGRQLEHWHTGSMTRRASALDAIEPEPVASIHPLDLERASVEPGGTITIESRRGKISLYARADDGMARGSIFIPFCYYEAAWNMLTNPCSSIPSGKIPEFKYCAVKIMAGGSVPAHLSFGGGVLLPEREPVPTMSALPGNTTGRPYTLVDSDFEWDETKAQSNLAKHGISFEAAASVFDDVCAVDLSDLDGGAGETRYAITGLVNDFTS